MARHVSMVLLVGLAVQVDLVGGIHKTISSLHLETWRNDMKDEDNSESEYDDNEDEDNDDDNESETSSNAAASLLPSNQVLQNSSTFSNF